MKPEHQFSAASRRFPLTDYSFHSGLGDCAGWSGPFDGDDDVRRFHKFTNSFILESKRERAKEMAVFALW